MVYIKHIQISIIILNEGTTLEESLFHLQPSKVLKRTSEGLYRTKFLLHLNNSPKSARGRYESGEWGPKVLELKWDLGIAGRETYSSSLWYGLEFRDRHHSFQSFFPSPSTCVSLVFALQPSWVYCMFKYSHRHINIHTCSEVKGGSGGVGGEGKMSKMCVFRGPVSHYIGVW